VTDHPQLLGPAEIRELAAKLEIRPTKRLGQNFVIDPGTIRRIVGLANLVPDDVVLEVGPGLGSLTLGLLAVARRVIAVEVDPVLAAQLPVTTRARAGRLADRLEVVLADAANVGELPGEPPTALVANLPYNVAVPVLLHVLDTLPTLRGGLVMVQAEVADRMCAAPGNRTYGIPSVKLAWYGGVKRVGAVSRSVFWPAPNVDSALVAFTRWTQREAGGCGSSGSGPSPGDRATGDTVSPRASAAGAGWRHAGVSRAEVFGVIDAAFAQRRKTLRAALAGWAGSADQAARLLGDAGVDPALRGEAIGVAEYVRIAKAARRARTIVKS
jgi:16S rRNA (adenine1518-N6/adenine1519-N6)-dimethyltransferase